MLSVTDGLPIVQKKMTFGSKPTVISCVVPTVSVLAMVNVPTFDDTAIAYLCSLATPINTYIIHANKMGIMQNKIIF
jgi:hypothetical protein